MCFSHEWFVIWSTRVLDVTYLEHLSHTTNVITSEPNEMLNMALSKTRSVLNNSPLKKRWGFTVYVSLYPYEFFKSFSDLFFFFINCYVHRRRFFIRTLILVSVSFHRSLSVLFLCFSKRKNKLWVILPSNLILMGNTN